MQQQRLSINRGATLIIDNGGTKHLHIVLNDPAVLEGYGLKLQVIVVPITTIYHDKHDKTVVLNIVDHEFLRHPSYVAYNFIHVYGCEELQSIGFSNKAPVSDELLERIITGALTSPHTKKYAKDLLRELTKCTI